MIVEGQPEESFVNVGLSLLLPYLEPYLIRSMQAAKPRVTAPDLLRDLAAFNGQEGQHYRQHIRFNEAIRLGGIPGLAELEAELDADYRRFSERRSLRWNLAYAEGFEAFTSAMARFSFEHGLLARMVAPARKLFEWHLVEELEHRCVAFDVYDHVFGGYFYRLFVGLYAQYHLNRFVLRVARLLETHDAEAFRAKYGGLGRKLERMRPLLWLAFLHLTPKILFTYLPWYTPHSIPTPKGADETAERYTSLAAPDGKKPRPAPSEGA